MGYRFINILIWNYTILPVFTTILPSQVAGRITGIIPGSELYAAQNVPPVQVIIPTSLVLVLGALFVMCVIATETTTRTIALPSTGQVLRLNQD